MDCKAWSISASVLRPCTWALFNRTSNRIGHTCHPFPGPIGSLDNGGSGFKLLYKYQAAGFFCRSAEGKGIGALCATSQFPLFLWETGSLLVNELSKGIQQGPHGPFPLTVSEHTQVHAFGNDENEIPESSMQHCFHERPVGFGVGKVYDILIEDKLVEEVERDRNAQSVAALKEGKNMNVIKDGKSDAQQKRHGKLPQVKPSGVEVWVGNLPKKKNVERDLRAVFKDVPGLLHIQPFVIRNEKTREPICKGSAFLTFSDLALANSFMRQFEGASISFGKVEKKPVYKLGNRLSAVSLGVTQESVAATEVSRLRGKDKDVDTSRHHDDALQLEKDILQRVEISSVSDTSRNLDDTLKVEKIWLDLEGEDDAILHAGLGQGVHMVGNNLNDSFIKIVDRKENVTLKDEGAVQDLTCKQQSGGLDCIKSQRSELPGLELWPNISGGVDHGQEENASFVGSMTVGTKSKVDNEGQESVSDGSIKDQVKLQEIDTTSYSKDDMQEKIQHMELSVQELQQQLGNCNLPQPSTVELVIANSQSKVNHDGEGPASEGSIRDQVNLHESDNSSYINKNAEDRIRYLELTVQELQLQLQINHLSKKVDTKTLSMETEHQQLKEEKIEALDRRVLKKVRSATSVKSKDNTAGPRQKKRKISLKPKGSQMRTVGNLGSANRLKKKERKFILGALSKYGKEVQRD